MTRSQLVVSAGAALAGRLVEQGRSVLVLEAGPDYRSADTPDAIRNWALGVGDDNPLYADEEYGPRTRWGTQIAHATMAGHVKTPMLGDPIPAEVKAQTKGLFRGVVAEPVKVRHAARAIVATQLVMLGLFTLAGHPWMYFILWFLPHLTVWRVINRLRSIAEHGGMRQSADRRETTHSVRQHLPARLTIVPYYTGWHLAHHVDSGIPFRNLPAYHDELMRSGYVQAPLEHPTYRALWRKLASG